MAKTIEEVLKRIRQNDLESYVIVNRIAGTEGRACKTVINIKTDNDKCFRYEYISKSDNSDPIFYACGYSDINYHEAFNQDQFKALNGYTRAMIHNPGNEVMHTTGLLIKKYKL